MASSFRIRKAIADSKSQGTTGENAGKQSVDSVAARNVRRREKAEEDTRMTRTYTRSRSIPAVIISWTFQILFVIMLAYLLVYFFGQSRTVIGQSMDTTLSGGDEVLINTLAYQMNGPKRGDIVSFTQSGISGSRSNIKRIIGLPGETIQIIDGMIYIDEKVYLEQKNYPAITNPGMAEQPIRLAENQYFVLGDNRNNSEDSRFAELGLITSSSIEGKVWFVLKPSSHRRFIRN